jgi:alkane 1-monooxygenase
LTGLGWPAKIGLALSVGMLGGVGINTAHEMGHKKDELERWLANHSGPDPVRPLLHRAQLRYHVRVATPR